MASSLNRRIISLAVPAILNNITVPLLGLSDTTIAGHLGSASFLAAMAVGAMMLNVVFWLCGFLRMGTTGLAAQAYGAHNIHSLRDIFRKSVIIALVISVAVLALQRPLERILFLIIAPETDVASAASLYFRICLWGAPAQLFIMVACGWFIGIQNTLIPMIISVGVNIVNIALSVVLVFVFETGFVGVAIGTLCANWIGAITAALIVWRKLPKADTSERGEPVSWGRFFKLNTDLFFRSACIMIVTLAMTSFGSRLGETTLAANAVIMQFFLFFSYFMDGFAFAGEAVVGDAAGAGNVGLQHRAVKSLMAWGAAMAVIFFVVYLCGVPVFTSLLTDSEAVRCEVVKMHSYIVALPPITVAAFIFDGIYIGLTRTRALFLTTLIASGIFFITVFSVSQFSNSVLWVAFELYLLLRGIFLAGLTLMPMKRKTDCSR